MSSQASDPEHAEDPIGPPAAARLTPAAVVVFDVMDTLIADPYREAHQSATGMTFEGFDALRPDGVYHAFERAEIREHSYWDALRQAKIPVDVARFHAARLAGYRWLPGARALLLETMRTHRVVLATNYPAEWLADLRERFFNGLELMICASCELGVRKPSSAFYQHLAARFALDPRITVLIDDTVANVDAAIALGWEGIVFRGAVEARQRLDSRLRSLPPPPGAPPGGRSRVRDGSGPDVRRGG